MHELAVTHHSRSTASAEDAEMIALVASGDRAAFERLYLTYHHRVARFLARMIRSRENLEEIIDDTFLVVWRNAKHFRNEARLSTWIMGIGYRTALKSMRGIKGEMVSQNIEDSIVDRRNLATECELSDWLRKGLDCLPEELRQILDLAYRLGFSVQEIAAITSSPIGTVKTRMFHAREKLRHHLPALGTPARFGYSNMQTEARSDHERG
jgi:RNA polymerase sigma-70 factor, ECF subfamily